MLKEKMFFSHFRTFKQEFRPQQKVEAGFSKLYMTCADDILSKVFSGKNVFHFFWTLAEKFPVLPKFQRAVIKTALQESRRKIAGRNIMLEIKFSSIFWPLG